MELRLPLTRRILIALVVVALIAGWFLVPSGRREVLVETVTVGTLDASYVARGVVRTEVFTLVAPYSCRVTFDVDENAAVKKAQALAHFDAWEVKQQLYEAQAEYWRAEGKFKQTVERLRIHPGDADVPLWRVQMEAERKELAIRARALDEVRGRMLAATVTSPLDGTVWRRWVADNDFVRAGDRVLDVVSSKAPWIEAQVSELDAALVSQGQKVTVRLSSGRELPATVSRVAPALEDVSGAGTVLRIRVSPQNEEGLLHSGQEVEVQGSTELARDALIAPRAAVVHEGAKAWVLGVAGGRTQRVAVRVGAATPTRVQLLEGPVAGTLLVVDRPDLLTEGAAVRPIRR